MGKTDRLNSVTFISSSVAAGRSDAELVAGLRADQAWARREIWVRYSGRVRRYLARALGRPSHDVEDLTQEVFLRLFVRRGAIRQPEALREFTMAVASHVLKWNLRSRWVRRKVRLSDDGELPEMAADRGSEEEAHDALRRCRVILDGLGARERVAFVLRFMEEMTMEEVAATMRVSLSSAKRLVNRATAAVAERVGSDADLRRYFASGTGTPAGSVSPGKKGGRP
ncbi:MAG TPA: sigma-70 family RNA polymerase sigma factor [Polyangia bacterium]